MKDKEEVTPAQQVVGAILEELDGRKGFRGWWDDIDDETRDELRRDLEIRATAYVPDSVDNGGGNVGGLRPIDYIIAYREALGRARNVVTDLEDIEWIPGRIGNPLDDLDRIAGEAERVAQVLRALHVQSQKSEGT